MNSFGISLNMFNDNENNNQKESILLEYIEEIQKKFIKQIEEEKLKNDTLLKENQDLKEKLNKSQEETSKYYENYIRSKECLDVQIKANKNLIQNLKKQSTNSFSISSIFNIFEQ